MKHVKLFESFIAEFNSPFSTDEVESANKFLSKETGLKIKENSTPRPALWPGLAIGKYRAVEMSIIFTKINTGKPFDEDNIKVDWINHASTVRGLKFRSPEADKLMKKWAKSWGFKISSSDEMEAIKDILPKDVRKMVEEFGDIISQAYGSDVELAY